MQIIILILLMVSNGGCHDRGGGAPETKLTPGEAAIVVKLLQAYGTEAPSKFYPEVMSWGRQVLNFQEAAVKRVISDHLISFVGNDFSLRRFTDDLVSPSHYAALSDKEKVDMRNLISELLYAHLMERVATYNLERLCMHATS